MQTRPLLSLFLLYSPFAFTQEISETESLPKRPTITAVRSLQPIRIDGILNEEVWQRPGDSTFTQRDPDEGAPATQKTFVWVAYDNEALYVAARLFDTTPDSIISRAGRRDAWVDSDRFYFGIDSYLDRRTGFYFSVTPGGSIQDGTLYNDSWRDDSWDGVWDVATRIDEKGWSVEMRIPFSQLRFRKQQDYVWGVNFQRRIERRREDAYFVMTPKKEGPYVSVSRFADLVGIRGIDPPMRLEVLPYAVSSGHFTKNFQSGDPFNDGRKLKGNLGADLKAGIGTSLTLDATINPDFGQVEVDPAVVNLTQYETFYQEKRPFFIEGANIFRFGRGGATSYSSFNWSDPQFFYSRRIGRAPQGFVSHRGFTDIPDRSTILGAGKLSGKIAEGWSLAALSALTQREFARIDSAGVRFTEEVEPLTYYGVVRSQREFKAGHQALGFLATSVLRDLRTPTLTRLLNRDAYVLALDGWTFLDSSRTWVFTGWSAMTHVSGSRERLLALQQSPQRYFQRPDAGHLSVDSSATSLTGWGGRFYLNKQKGNTYVNLAFGILSPGLEANDLGYHFRSDVINGHIILGYNWFQPDKIFRYKAVGFATFRNYNFGGNKTGEGYFTFINWQFLNYWGGDIYFGHFPKSLNDSRTRGGPLMENPAGSFGNINFQTDSRRILVFSAAGGLSAPHAGGWSWWTRGQVEWKPTTTVTLRISPELSRSVNTAQYIRKKIDRFASATYGTRYVFASIDQITLSSSIRVDWTLTPKLSLQIYLQPLLSTGRYDEFKELAKPKTYTFNRYGQDGSTISFSNGVYRIDPDGQGPAEAFTFSNPDFNFKSLRGNAVLRWEYMPGSTLYLVWTQSRVNFDNAGNFHFGRDVRHLFSSQPDNVFLVKISYWWNP